MSTVSLSVLLPVYQEEFATLVQTIDSIANQTVLPQMVFILDDCPDFRSDDEYSKIICMFPQLRFRIQRNTTNFGLALSLNTSLANIKTEYCARVDCGDRLSWCRFEKQVAFLEKNRRISLVGAQVRTVNSDSSKTSQFPTTPVLSRLLSYFSTSVAHPTFLFRSSILKDVSYPNVRLAQDFGFLNRLRKSGFLFSSLPDCLVDYHDSSCANRAYRRRQTISVAVQAFGLDSFIFFKRILNSRDFSEFSTTKKLVLVVLLMAGVALRILAKALMLIFNFFQRSHV